MVQGSGQLSPGKCGQGHEGEELVHTHSSEAVRVSIPLCQGAAAGPKGRETTTEVINMHVGITVGK